MSNVLQAWQRWSKLKTILFSQVCCLCFVNSYGTKWTHHDSWLICVWFKLTVAVTNLNAAPLRLHTIPELHSRQGIQPHVHQWHGEIREVRITCPLVSGLSLSDETLSQLLGALHILWAKLQKPSKKLPYSYLKNTNCSSPRASGTKCLDKAQFCWPRLEGFSISFCN